jgi:hypothetical protein
MHRMALANLSKVERGALVAAQVPLLLVSTWAQG